MVPFRIMRKHPPGRMNGLFRCCDRFTWETGRVADRSPFDIEVRDLLSPLVPESLVPQALRLIRNEGVVVP